MPTSPVSRSGSAWGEEPVGQARRPVQRLRGQIAGVHRDIGELRGELHSEIALVRADITRLKERFDEHLRAYA